MTGEIVVRLAEAVAPDLEGRTFQVHLLPGDRLRLYPVEISREAMRCPAVVGGERCCLTVGHFGKHRWAGGD